jgi:hypothetical protein
VTAKSRLAAFVLILLSMFAPAVLGKLFGLKHEMWWIVEECAVVGPAIYWLVLWPQLVRFKPWAPSQYRLPESRIIEYTLVSVAVLFLLFYAAVRFRWGK